MGEAFITRRGSNHNLAVNYLEDYSTSSSTNYKGFDFKNKSYFIRLRFDEGNRTYMSDFLIERGTVITKKWTPTTHEVDYLIKELIIDVDAGTLYIDRQYATVIINQSLSVVVEG